MADERLEVRRQLLEVPRAHGAAARRQLGCAACFLQWKASVGATGGAETAASPMQGGQMQYAPWQTNRREKGWLISHSPAVSALLLSGLSAPYNQAPPVLTVSRAYWDPHLQQPEV